MIDERIKYWTQGQAQMNFGDYLAEYLYARALIAPVVDADRYRLLGSAIDADILHQDLAECAHLASPCVVLWCCGARSDSPLPDSLLARCRLLGVRGPLSRDALELPADTPLGDPGLLLPLLRPAAPATGRTLCVPHCNDPAEREALLALSGADELALPLVADLSALEQLIDRISGASFVLAGSLHAAIVACAYGVPFGFWDSGFVDVPFKWRDFAASVGASSAFSRNVAQARERYEGFRLQLQRPPLSGILGCCPFAVRPEVLLRAIALDAGLATDVQAAWYGVAATLSSARMDWIDDLRGHDAERRSQRRVTECATALPASGSKAFADLADRLEWASERIESAVLAGGFSFDDGQTDLTFSRRSAGAAFLRQGWTRPNEVAPWAVESHATLVLPHVSRWWSWPRLDLGLIAFAPAEPPVGGRRHLQIRGNDMDLGDFVITNQGEGDTVYATITLWLPQVLRQRAGELLLVFGSSVLVSARTLGIGDDHRTLSFAPTSLKAHSA